MKLRCQGSLLRWTGLGLALIVSDRDSAALKLIAYAYLNLRTCLKRGVRDHGDKLPTVVIWCETADGAGHHRGSK
jgi:hypothetical protein